MYYLCQCRKYITQRREIYPSSINTKVKHANVDKIPHKSGVLTLSSDRWQYIKAIHSRALKNIEQKCKVEIGERTSIEFT